MSSLSIIIPCYNEEKRLNSEKVFAFLEDKRDVSILFVNDGSTDKTLVILENIQQKYPARIEVLSNDRRKGKAESVRQGLIKSHSNEGAFYYGFMDADLAVSFNELYRLFEIISSSGKKFILGSRIKKIGAIIQRNEWRHFYSRFIATIIGFITRMNVYDTQCSAKIFDKETIPVIFNDHFKTKWLFDAEIICRLFNQYGELDKSGMEEPLLQWTEVKGSKLHWSNIFSILREIAILNKYYKAK